MAVLIRPRRWTDQPPVNAGVNWSHPLARGLVFCLTFAELAGAPHDLVRSGGGVPQNGPTWSGRGREYVGGAGANYDQFPLVDSPFIQASGLTIFWRGVIDDLTTFRHFAGKHLSGGGADNPFDYRTDGASNLAIVRANAGGARSSTSTGSPLQAGKLTSVAVTLADNLIETVAAGYVDGTSVAMAGAGAPTGAVTGTAADIFVGRRIDGTTVAMKGADRNLYIWSRPLTADEMRWLYVEPYAFLTPKARKYPGSPPAAPLPPHPNPLLQNAVYRM